MKSSGFVITLALRGIPLALITAPSEYLIPDKRSTEYRAALTARLN